MSTRNLLKFLRKIDVELAKKSKTYRTKYSDKTAHAFRLSKAVLYKETLSQLERMEFPELSEKEKANIKTLSDNAYLRIKNVTQMAIKETSYIDPKMSYFNNNSFRAYFVADDRYNVFNRIKRVYKTELQQYFEDLKKLLLRKRSKDSKFGRESLKKMQYSGQFFNLGHAPESAVFESGLAFSLDRILNQINDVNLHTWMVNNQEEFMTRYITLMGTKDETVWVTIESAFDNFSRGGAVGREKQLLRQDLTKAIKRLEKQIMVMPGSDSLYDVKRKKTIKAVTDPFKKVKNVTVKTEDTKIRSSSKTPTVFEKRVGVKKGGKLGGAIRDPRTGRFISKHTAQSPLNLLAILNAKLPEYVARNMIFPALRYRTGRFATSVRAINIQQTEKGFPSIGYTYQKFPYQTFEPGYAQGSPERDPRTLIDKSIREIAAEVQLGRFFTRRI